MQSRKMSDGAAAYYNLTTYRPDSVDVAIRRKAKISTMPDWPQISVFYFPEERFETGLSVVREGKNQFRIYDIEKTVVDAIESNQEFQGEWKNVLELIDSAFE